MIDQRQLDLQAGPLDQERLWVSSCFGK